MNKLLVDLDEKVTRQNTTIADLTDKVGRLEQLTQDNNNLKFRVKILETLTAEMISQTPPDIIDTNSANLNTASFIHSSHHDTSTSNRQNKRRKQTKPDPWVSGTTPRKPTQRSFTYTLNSVLTRQTTQQRTAYVRPQLAQSTWEAPPPLGRNM